MAGEAGVGGVPNAHNPLACKTCSTALKKHILETQPNLWYLVKIEPVK